MSRSSLSRKTKDEILVAYNQLAKENQGLKAQVEAASARSAESPVRRDPPASEAGPETAGPAAAPTIESVIDALAALRSGFGTAVSALSAKLIGEASALERVRRDSEAERARLAELYNIEVAENTLEALIEEYERKSRVFDEELDAVRIAFERETAEMRRAWQTEQEEHALAVKERDAASKKSRQRETTEYKYALETARKLDADAYERRKQELEEEIRALEEAGEKSRAEREESIARGERRFEELRAKVEGFPKELEAAVKRARDEGATTARQQAKVRADLFAKEVDGNRRVFELRIESLAQVDAKQAQQIEELSAQLTATLKQAHDMAVKAIEGASTETSFRAVKEIAMEQAKTQQRG